jgi:thiol-disulfide isomerase/thioredoxin
MLTERVRGLGLKGGMSYGFWSMEGYDSTALLAFPTFRGLPDSLTELKKYCIILDDYQFYYQNYKNGKYTKGYFMEMANAYRCHLKDTIYLTKNMVKNTIPVIAGYDRYKSPVYIVDANNNNDFSDDTLRHLYSGLNSQEDILANSYYVDYEFYDGKSIIKGRKLLNVRTYKGREDELSLYFSFPELYYSKIKYGNKTYLIFQESYNHHNKAIYVLEDRPYFSWVGDKCEVRPNQYINLGNEFYTYMPSSLTPGSIVIKKANISRAKFDEQIAEKAPKSLSVSNQIGMMAPPIEGLNIINDSTISLKQYLGKYVFLDFWATSCGPCIMEFPNLLKAYEKFDRSNFEIIGIVQDDTKGKIQQFIKKRNVIWPNIITAAPKTDVSGYEINYFPTTYLIDPEGKIIATDLRGDDLMKRLELLKVKKN